MPTPLPVSDTYQKQMVNLINAIKTKNVPDIKSLVNFKTTPIVTETPADRNAYDPKDDFKGFMNKFVINKMLYTPESKMRFLRLIAYTFNNIINEYNRKNNLHGTQAVVFLYKGGNLLRIFYKRFLDNYKIDTSVNVDEIINEVFAPEFSKSDDDFTILINPGLETFDKVHSDMTYLSYVALGIIRDELESKPGYYFDYFQLDDSAKRATLVESLKKAIDDDAFKTLSNEESPYNGYEIVGMLLDDTYVPVPPVSITMDKFLEIVNKPVEEQNYLLDIHPIEYRTLDSVKNFSKGNDNDETQAKNSYRSDFFILHKDTQSYIYPSTNSKKELIYVAHNTISFDGPTGLTSFVLNRSKINAKLYLKKSSLLEPDSLIYTMAPGELIDVTIATEHDTGLDYMYASGLKHNIATYIFHYDGTTFELNGYSFDYLIHDLENILFTQTHNQPWTDKKYEKRIKRLVYLTYLEAITKYRPDGAERYFDKITKYFAEANQCFKAHQNCAKFTVPPVSANEPGYNLMSIIANMYGDLSKKSEIDLNAVKFIQAVTRIFNNTDVIAKAVTHDKNKVDYQAIDKSKIDVKPDFLGGSRRMWRFI